MTAAKDISRRRFLSGSGSLVVSFSLLPQAVSAQQAATGRARLPGNLENNPMLDAWIRIDTGNRITVFTGKAELGQGTKTSLLQIAAEHLDADPKAIDFITADTGRTPDEGYTAGSATVSGSGTALDERRRPGPPDPDRSRGRDIRALRRPAEHRRRRSARTRRTTAGAMANSSPAMTCMSAPNLLRS